jgi:hypothetical protein
MVSGLGSRYKQDIPNQQIQANGANKMTRKIFSISTISLAVFLTLTHSAIAAAEAYKTSRGQVVVTGLEPAQRYQIRTLSTEGKPGTRQDKSANSCGEVVVESAARYQRLVVGTVSVEPATLPVRTHARCQRTRNGQNPSSTVKPRGVI